MELRCMTNYLWTYCNMWLVCWIMCDLGLYVGWFKILRDTRWTTGFIWAQVWWFDCLSGCYCTCALINWTVQLHKTRNTTWHASEWTCISKQEQTTMVLCTAACMVSESTNRPASLAVQSTDGDERFTACDGLKSPASTLRLIISGTPKRLPPYTLLRSRKCLFSLGGIWEFG